MGTFEQIKNDLTEAMTAKQGTQPYDTVAQVVRVDGNTAWVHIPGGVDETPVAMTVNAKSGDSVRVRVSGGSAWITGSDSAPPTDDRMANIANTRAVEANTKAASAEQLAEEASTAAGSALGIAQTAQQIADNTAQHFWFTEEGTDTGAHITEVTQEEFEADPANGGGNLLARTNGIALRNGLIELATLQQSGMDINTFDTQGNLISIAHLGYGSGTDSGGGTSVAPFYTFGTRTGTVGNYSTAEGYNTTASGYGSHAEGNHTQATATNAHAEGNFTQATGQHSHAEGYDTRATARSAHAEGDFCRATGEVSHAEGDGATAVGVGSHAAGLNTTAGSDYQTVIGRQNIRDDTGTYAVIVGNGSIAPQTYSNALALAWDGETELALDTTAASGTADGDLYAAITTLGWTADVIA